MEHLANKIGSILTARNLLLTTAESCTGGWVAKVITDMSGCSVWFDRGFVTYSNQSKIDMLGVEHQTLETYGAVSEAVVREMVLGALEHSNAHVAIAVSGIAGPTGGTPHKPVGTVWFAWGVKNQCLLSKMHLLKGDRDSVRTQAVHIALHGILEVFEQTD